MILKTELRKTIDKVLEDNEVDGKRALAEELLDKLEQEFGDEIYDDTEDEEPGQGPPILGED